MFLVRAGLRPGAAEGATDALTDSSLLRISIAPTTRRSPPEAASHRLRRRRFARGGPDVAGRIASWNENRFITPLRRFVHRHDTCGSTPQSVASLAMHQTPAGEIVIATVSFSSPPLSSSGISSCTEPCEGALATITPMVVLEAAGTISAALALC